MTLTQRLFALRDDYARMKSLHRELEPIAREMSEVMVKILKRENAQDRRVANAHR